MLHLVRHGRSQPVAGEPPHRWELDPAGFDDVWDLRESGRLPDRAAWFCSPEPKAVGTAQLLTEGEVGILSAHATGDLVLVGHGTAWTVLVAALTGTRPDLARWSVMTMPDVILVPLPEGHDRSAMLGT